MGGEHYTHTGGGGNYLCLPKTPKYDRYKDGHQGGGYVYGAEYELSFNPFKKSLNDHDPPCVVCFVQSSGSMLMMPARNDCPTGWTEEYHGYLMTEHYNHIITTRSNVISSALTKTLSLSLAARQTRMVHYSTL